MRKKMSENYQWASFIIAWISLTLCGFGLLSNIISIIIYSHPIMRSPINILLVGLSIIDLFLCLLAVGAFCIPGMAEFYDSARLDALVAYAAVYVYPWTMVTQTCSVWTFVVITFERFVAVCYPFKARWCSISRSLRALAIVAILSFLYNLPRFFEFELLTVKIVDNYGETRTVIIAEARLRNSTAHSIYMTVYYCAFYLLTHFAIPFSILVLGNTLMVIAVCRAHRQRQLLSNQEKREHKTAYMMILVVFVFVSCNTLAFVLNFVEEVDPDFFVAEDSILLAWVLNDVNNLLVIFNASTTAVIYTACSEKYRKLLITLWLQPYAFYCSWSARGRLNSYRNTLKDTPMGSGKKVESQFQSRDKKKNGNTAPLLQPDRYENGEVDGKGNSHEKTQQNARGNSGNNEFTGEGTFEEDVIV